MSLKYDLVDDVREIFRHAWEIRNGYVVPDTSSLGLGNQAIVLDAVVLYADISESTLLVDQNDPRFAAEVYKAFLHCAAKIVRSQGGEITAYDGDRIMSVFLGDSKNSSAARAGLMINWAKNNIINPAIKVQYPNTAYRLVHTVGIDASELFVARTGVRGANDLVWVGRAANHAAKLCTLSHNYPTRITGDVYERLMKSVKKSGDRIMWEEVNWTEMGRNIYRSSWGWEI